MKEYKNNNHMNAEAWCKNHSVGDEVKFWIGETTQGEGTTGNYVGFDLDTETIYMRHDGKVNEYSTRNILLPGAPDYNPSA